MLTVTGFYDGEKIHLLQKVEKKKNYKVIITFLESITGEEEFHTTRPYVVNESFSFWEDSGEDLFDDYVSKDPPQE